MIGTRTRVAGLVVALTAAVGLIVLTDDNDPPAGPARTGAEGAWPAAQRAEIPGNLADGPIFHPGLFLDARTAVGTAPTPAGDAQRLIVREAGGTVRELRRLPQSQNPVFDSFTTDGTTLAWTETTGARTEVWAAGLSGASRLAHRLTAGTGNLVGYGSQYDLVIADGRVHWVAAVEGGAERTEIRSVALTGGPVTSRVEPGVWQLTAWPWLVNGNDRTGSTLLRNPAANRQVEVATTGAELASCSPAWCRVQVIDSEGLARIDAMRPDGSDRRRIAGGEAKAAITDVAVLDRFEILARARPDSDLTGTEALSVYDLAERRTVELSSAVDGAFSRNGVLWWATGGERDATVWHTLDLRTIR